MEKLMTSDYRTELNKNGVIAFVPSGNSMWPIFKHRNQSVVVVSKTERLKKYDVALYVRDNGVFVLHRVMEVTPYGYIMCGDSQFALEKVNEQSVFGIMQGFYKGKKYVESTDAKYVKKVEKWYKRKRIRKLRLKIFHFCLRVKGKLKRMFKKGGK